MLCAKFGWHWPSGSGEGDFLIISMYFCYFVIISPWKGLEPFIWTNPLHWRLLWTNFKLKLAQWFGEEDFFNFVNEFLLFHNYLPLEKYRTLHFNKLESPSPKDALSHVWLKLAQWFWRRRLLNFVNVFLLFHNYLPLEKGGALHLNNLESPSSRKLCAKFA